MDRWPPKHREEPVVLVDQTDSSTDWAVSEGRPPTPHPYRIPTRRRFTSPKPHRRQQCASPPSPPDSGYGSKVAGSPQSCNENEQLTVAVCSSLAAHAYDSYDGSGSRGHGVRGDSETSTSDDVDLLPSASPPQARKYFTLPKASSRATDYASFVLQQPMVQQRRGSDAAIPRKGAKSSLRHPDRFVPVRDPSTPNSEKFKTTKPIGQMSTVEKLLRHERETPDAFRLRPRRNGSMAFDPRIISSSEAHSVVREGFRTALAVITSTAQRSRTNANRQSSSSSVWAVGGVAPDADGATVFVDDGRGNFTLRGSTTRFFSCDFVDPNPKSEDEAEQHQGRLAAALDIDRALRVFDFDFEDSPFKPSKRNVPRWDRVSPRKTFWNGAQWVNDAKPPRPPNPETVARALPSSPFRVLDAPRLRDDFYCSVLAYSPLSHVLAVGLGSSLYTWSETAGVNTLNSEPYERSYITSIDFSSFNGGKEILAYGSSNKMLSMIALHERRPRMELQQPDPIACIS